eukprot:12060583-Prorocentrum_lima.AAC.1
MVRDRLPPQPWLACPSRQAMNWMAGAIRLMRKGRPALSYCFYIALAACKPAGNPASATGGSQRPG